MPVTLDKKKLTLDPVPLTIPKSKSPLHAPAAMFKAQAATDPRHRAMLNNALWQEAERFHAKLAMWRAGRIQLESEAATKIQASVRARQGRQALVSGSELEGKLATRKRVWGTIVASLTEQNVDWVLTSRQHTWQNRAEQATAATRLQSAQRAKISRSRVDGKRRDAEAQGMESGASAIQRSARARAARAVTEMERQRARVACREVAVETIQTHVRRHHAALRVGGRRDALRTLAAMMVQCRFRICGARQRVAQVRAQQASS